jgi:hypothetical protein
MKKVGVALTPLRTPPMKSLRTLFLNWPVSSALLLREAELRADRKTRGDPQRALVFEQGIVHIPKQPRCAGELRAFGGDLGMRVYFGQWEMTENKLQTPTKRQSNLIDDGMSPRAMRTFMVAVFDKRNRRVCRAADVITMRDWNFQGGHDRSPGLPAFPASPRARDFDQG